MTVEQIKEEAKKRFNKDITDEQAKAWLDAHGSKELSEEELDSAAGGGCGSDVYIPIPRLPEIGYTPKPTKTNHINK